MAGEIEGCWVDFESGPQEPGATAGQHPPGWFRDPRDPGRFRYWDGLRWTEHTYPGTWAPGGPNYRPLDALARVLSGLLAIALLLGLVAVVSDWAELS